MKEIMKKPGLLTAITAATLLLIACLPLAGTVTAAEPAKVIVQVPQSFTVLAGSPPSSTFEYKLTSGPDNPSAPLPTGTGGANGNAYEYSATGNASEYLNFAFDSPGYYDYRLECVTPDRPHYTIDRRVYAIEITVAANMSPVTVAYDISIVEDKTNPAYDHSYSYVDPPPPPPPEYGSVTVEKVLKNADGETITPGNSDVFTVVLKQNGREMYTFTLNRSNNFRSTQNRILYGYYTIEETVAAPGGLGSYDISYSPSGARIASGSSEAIVTVTNKLKSELPPPQGPSVTIDKRVDKTIAGPGEDINYTLEVTNNGNEVLNDLVISDNRLSGHTGAVTVTLSRAGASSRILPASKYTFSGGRFSGFKEPDANEPLKFGTGDKIFITYTLSFDEEGEYTNTAIVTGTGADSGEEVQARDSVTVTVTDEYIELDEDGTPLGIWRWDPELGWIFEEFPPLANLPQTGQLRWPVPALTALGVLLFILGLALNRKRTRPTK